MKFILIVCCVFIMAAMTNAAKVKRANTAPTAYPTVPSLINILTSNLFQRGNWSGESAIYQFLSNLSSMVYPAIANATFGFFYSLNPVLAGISSNIYYGLCAPPTPRGTASPTAPPGMTLPPPTGTSTTPSLLLSILPLLLGGLSGKNSTMPGGGTMPTMSPGGNPLSSILSMLLGTLSGKSSGGGSGGGSSPTTSPGGSGGGSSPTTSPGGSGAGSSPLGALGSIIPLLLAPLIGGLSGGSNSSNPLSGLSGGNSTSGGGSGGGSSPTTSPGGSGGGIFPTSNPSDPLAFLRNVIGNKGYNGTFNMSDAAFISLLASIGQTPLKLQITLSLLGLSPLQFINNFSGAIAQLGQYLSQLFSQAAALTTAQPTTGTGTNTGSLGALLNPVLTGLGNLLAGLG